MSFDNNASEYAPTVDDISSDSDVTVSLSLGDPMKPAPEASSRSSSPSRFSHCFRRGSSPLTSINSNSLLSLPSDDSEGDVNPSGWFQRRNSENDGENLAVEVSSQPSSHDRGDDNSASEPQHIHEVVGPEPTKRRFAGIPLSGYCPKVPPLHRVSAFVTRTAPCFWCCYREFQYGITNRVILHRLNLLCAFFAVGQIAAGGFLLFLLVSNSFGARDYVPSLWTLNSNVLFLGMVACIILVTTVLALRTVREVNIRGSILYLWVLLWLLPLHIFFLIGLVDVHQVTYVWIKHWWVTPTMTWFRRWYCVNGTYDTLCLVPVGGEPGYNGEEQWCLGVYNATNCSEIRNNAQSAMITDAYIFYYSVAGWALLAATVLFLTINMLETIITRPIVQQSREANIPLWMLLPTAGCFAAGSFLFLSSSSITKISDIQTGGPWIGILYISCGFCFFLSALLAGCIRQFSILDTNDKKNKVVAVIGFIGINILAAITLGMCILASLSTSQAPLHLTHSAFASNIVAIITGSILASIRFGYYPITDEERGAVACNFDTARTCSYCGNRIGEQECPEWTAGDVTSLLQAEYKMTAILAVIFITYAISATRYGILAKKHISSYQIDYV